MPIRTCKIIYANDEYNICILSIINFRYSMQYKTFNFFLMMKLKLKLESMHRSYSALAYICMLWLVYFTLSSFVSFLSFMFDPDCFRIRRKLITKESSSAFWK